MTFVCVTCNNMLDKPCSTGASHTKQTCCHPVVDSVYWTLLVTYNKWNIVNFFNKNTPKEYFDYIHKFVLGGIIDNNLLFMKTGKYGDICTTYPTTTGYYFTKFISDTVTLQYDNTTDWKVLKSGKISIKYAYLGSMKAKTNKYC